MFYIFLDESGDLGLDLSKQRTTQFFLVTIMFVKDKRKIEKIVKKVHYGIQKKYKKFRSILHANSEKAETKKLLLSMISKTNTSVMTIFLNKRKVYTKLKKERDVLYNFVVNRLLDIVYRKNLIPVEEEVTLIASRKETNKFLNMNFRNYLLNKLNSKYKLKLKIEIKTPHEDKCLQAVDFISWSIFRKYEYEDDSYYDIIRDNIVEESPIYS
ncbi:MAG: hypothetical protein A2X61_00315 [Ignavibacteria bacterium GWB2_35_12]|nr:MAG: hypothetical protein A2X63_02120 [Ignavibacteria bacterium GWA2_35_8]OGU41739.1 MAG: hypothetical protein A2X61_00315 [Ignavibacteria bacterium GWB2_35_12]OGU90578.1 MAG: hypothetical protein A2220_12895 [Ignavibacteria bacterium RIFOXYA2_FULL_35_10]OGV23332.1 MAG: hypothetical protein A2475_06730 [Ignavibacteria bacterium RIFOXYC2_FULL_35_21]